jgi:tetraacyldisaccharide 4'-kinase
VLAGIARPERLETDVAGLGVTVVGRRFFPDHHAYRPDEILAVADDAARSDAEVLVTTAKDAVRVPQQAILPVIVLRLALDVEGEERLVARVLAAARGSA